MVKTITQRESGETESVLKDQLEKGLDTIGDVKNCIIAYEPVWAIGTGLTASNEQVEIAHKFIREFIGNKYDRLVKIIVRNSRS